MTNRRDVVWEGRFQPIHFGHLGYVGRMLDNCDSLTVVVVANELSTAHTDSVLAVPWFSRQVDHHHRLEKNPWPLRLRVDLVKATLDSEFGRGAVTVVGGHRLDLDWNLWDQLLPQDRIFVTPLRDAFEDDKARAWAALGQRVERLEVQDLPKISATDVRRRLADGRSVDGWLHPQTIEISVREYGKCCSKVHLASDG